MISLLSSTFLRAYELAAPYIGRLLGADLVEETVEHDWFDVGALEGDLTGYVHGLNEGGAEPSVPEPMHHPRDYAP